MKTITLSLPALLVSSLVLAGCSGPLATIQSKIPFLNKSTSAPQGAIGQVVEAGKMSAMISTGKSGVCTVSNRETGETTELFIKGKKMKFSGTSFGGPEAENLMYPPQPTKIKTISYFLNDGEYTYIWEKGAKSGIKSKIPSEEELKKMNDAMPSTKPGDEVPTDTSAPDLTKFESDDSYTINCNLKDLPDSEFMPPADVEFMDFSQMTQDLTQSMPAVEEGSSMPGSAGMKLPEGMELPEGFEGEIPAEQ